MRLWIGALAGLLVASLLGNAALGWAWIGARDGRAKAISERDAAQQLARECSRETERLAALADERAATSKKAQAVARTAALAREQLAQSILSTPPAIPGDDCGSAMVRVDAWLSGRAAP